MNKNSFKEGKNMPKTKKQCEELRSIMKNKILDKSLIYFAKNGYAGTKISDLAKYIGIGQGTLYSYFSSKEELFKVIVDTNIATNEQGLLELINMPISAAHKIFQLSKHMIHMMKEDNSLAYMFVLNMQYSIENGFINSYTKAYEEKPNKILSEIIHKGQEDDKVVTGDPYELADLYWSMVHTMAFKKIFNNNHEIFKAKNLARLLLKDDVINELYKEE